MAAEHNCPKALRRFRLNRCWDARDSCFSHQLSDDVGGRNDFISGSFEIVVGRFVNHPNYVGVLSVATMGSRDAFRPGQEPDLAWPPGSSVRADSL